ncbi:MAG: hypothetical protein EHM14_00410 [Methanothrix sp.]|nr:MAG: hypothetical protein EHM14_00410 [Methanothrix sp.]
MDKRSFQKNGVRRLFITIFILAAISGMAIAADSASYPRTIVDDAGREVTIKMPVEKIIPLDAGAAKTLYLLGAQDKIIVVGDDVVSRSGYLPGVKDKQSVGKWHEYDYEMIGELAKEGEKTVPNIIVLCTVSGMDPVSEIAPALEGFPDIAVIGLDTYKMEKCTVPLAGVCTRCPRCQAGRPDLRLVLGSGPDKVLLAVLPARDQPLGLQRWPAQTHPRFEPCRRGA